MGDTVVCVSPAFTESAQFPFGGLRCLLLSCLCKSGKAGDVFGVAAAGVKAHRTEQPLSAGCGRMGRGEVVAASSAEGAGDPSWVPVPWGELHNKSYFMWQNPEFVWHWKYHSELAGVVSLLKGGMEVIQPSLTFCYHLNSIMNHTLVEGENKSKQINRGLIDVKESFPKAAHIKTNVMSWAEDFQQIVVGAYEMRDRLFRRSSWGTDLGFYLFVCYILV